MIDCGQWKLKWKKFIFVIVKKILCLENCTFHKQQAALRCVSVQITFVAVEYNIRRSLNYAFFWHNWNLLEGWGSIGQLISWLWKFEPRSSTRLMPNFSFSLSHQRHIAVSFKPTCWLLIILLKNRMFKTISNCGCKPQFKAMISY